jgi:hypothetical protein
MQEDQKITHHVIYSIAVTAPITPAEPLPSLLSIPRGSLVVVDGQASIQAEPLTDLIKEDEARVTIVDLGLIEGRIEERIEFLGMHPDQKDFHF